MFPSIRASEGRGKREKKRDLRSSTEAGVGRGGGPAPEEQSVPNAPAGSRQILTAAESREASTGKASLGSHSCGLEISNTRFVERIWICLLSSKTALRLP